jgi:hypothetical protein
MARMTTVAQRRIAFNKATLDILRTSAPAHAEELNARGTSNGWWATVEYARTSGRTPEQAAEILRAAALPR